MKLIVVLAILVLIAYVEAEKDQDSAKKQGGTDVDPDVSGGKGRNEKGRPKSESKNGEGKKQGDTDVDPDLSGGKGKKDKPDAWANLFQNCLFKV